jgi:glucose/arabinose dehydrogenase
LILRGRGRAILEGVGRAAAVVLIAALALAACGSTASPAKTIATGLHVPWGLAFEPNGDALVSERTTGDILRIPAAGGAPQKVMHIPDAATGMGEGGLLGIALSPDYAKDGLVYAYYTTQSDNRIVRFTLGGTIEPIFTGIANGAIHDGGRIAFGPDGKLYAGTGETGNGPLAQDLGSPNGKILRMNPDGSVPSDNPFPGSRVWTYGHRNVQGLSWDRAGRLWESELGQNAFDEVNLIRKGHNYGWPNVEGRGDTSGGKYTNPQATFRTSDASPSGDAVIGNRLYMAALGGQSLYRMKLKGARVVGKPKRLFNGRWGRLRTVARAPDGKLWITTSNTDGRGSPTADDDRIIAITPP